MGGREFAPRFSALNCALPALLAFGHLAGYDDSEGSHLQLAIRLTTTCYLLANQSESGLLPELVSFRAQAQSFAEESRVEPEHDFSSLRPGFAQSLFYVWLATKNRQYIEWGWEQFLAIRAHARLHGENEVGFASVAHSRFGTTHGTPSFDSTGAFPDNR